MPSRPTALIIGLLSLAASVGSSLWAWQMDKNDLFDGIAFVVLVGIAVATACWGLAHVIAVAFGVSFRPRGSRFANRNAKPS